MIVGTSRAVLRRAIRQKVVNPGERPGETIIRKHYELETQDTETARYMKETSNLMGEKTPEEQAESQDRADALMRKAGRSREEKHGHGPGTGHVFEQKDKETYARSKDEKFGNYTGAADISSQDTAEGDTASDVAGKKAARDVALDFNPFAGTSTNIIKPPNKKFMEYVEEEQNYYQRSQTESQALALGRKKAKTQAEKLASEARTQDIFGTGMQTPKAGFSRAYSKPLLVAKYDMNSFTLSNGHRLVGSCILYNGSYYLWDVEQPDEITMDSMMPIAHMFPVPKFILLGTGLMQQPLHPDVVMFLRSRGTRVEVRSTEEAIADWHTISIDRLQAALCLTCNEPTNGFDYVPYHRYWKKAKEMAHGHTDV